MPDEPKIDYDTIFQVMTKGDITKIVLTTAIKNDKDVKIVCNADMYQGDKKIGSRTLEENIFDND